jgi:hypothetical protein
MINFLPPKDLSRRLTLLDVPAGTWHICRNSLTKEVAIRSRNDANEVTRKEMSSQTKLMPPTDCLAGDFELLDEHLCFITETPALPDDLFKQLPGELWEVEVSNDTRPYNIALVVGDDVVRLFNKKFFGFQFYRASRLKPVKFLGTLSFTP